MHRSGITGTVKKRFDILCKTPIILMLYEGCVLETGRHRRNTHPLADETPTSLTVIAYVTVKEDDYVFCNFLFNYVTVGLFLIV